MLDRLKRAISPRPKLTAYERQVLEREHDKLSRKMQRLADAMGQVHCASCVKQEDPQAQRIMAEQRAVKRTLEDIEWKLGYTPEARSKRVQRKRATRRA